MAKTTTAKSEAKAVEVTVVNTQGQASLVEYVDAGGRPRRAFVPASAIVDGVCQDPEAGIPYGDDWEAKLVGLQTTPAAIADELRRRGLWTLDDVRRNPTLAMSALQAAYGLDLARLLAA